MYMYIYICKIFLEKSSTLVGRVKCAKNDQRVNNERNFGYYSGIKTVADTRSAMKKACFATQGRNMGMKVCIFLSYRLKNGIWTKDLERSEESFCSRMVIFLINSWIFNYFLISPFSLSIFAERKVSVKGARIISRRNWRKFEDAARRRHVQVGSKPRLEKFR